MRDTEICKWKVNQIATIIERINANVLVKPLSKEENSSETESARQLCFEKIKQITDELRVFASKD